MTTGNRQDPAPPSRQIPRGVWVLGFVSLLMDISSEMIHSLLPLFMVTVLGSSALTIGLIEGMAEATALMVKVFSGTLSDYLGRRKGLALLGYGLGALTKPLFAIATGSGLILTAACWTESAKAFEAPPVMRWWPTSPPLSCAAPPLACATPSTRSAPCWGHCWPSD
nr:hypothetical protein [Aeromonas hydrophila]